MTNPNNNQPTHRAYVVEGPKDAEIWTEIGALWPHEDAKGFNLVLRALPPEQRIVLRKAPSKTEAKR